MDTPNAEHGNPLKNDLLAGFTSDAITQFPANPDRLSGSESIDLILRAGAYVRRKRTEEAARLPEDHAARADEASEP